MADASLSKIESEVQEFLRASYPEMVVRAEFWTEDRSRVALYFIDEAFRGLYPRQRYHRLVRLIPRDYFHANLADCIWFELTPAERSKDVNSPDESLIAAIAPDVLRTLQERGFFVALDGLLCPVGSHSKPETCSGDFRLAKQALKMCEFAESDWSDVFHVLMEEGAFCDCEILFNTQGDSRLKTQYWRGSHEGHG